jgi:prepilin-type N-terminal cleavage/methylation domain-containing protein
MMLDRTRHPESRAPHDPRAFTLVELLVVISIIAIGATLLVPSFTRLLRSVNYANAVNTVSASLGSARALAIRNQRHTAVAFMFDVEREVCSVQVLELQSAATGSLVPDGSRPAFIYRPATGQAPIELPRGTAVYGLSFQVVTDPAAPPVGNNASSSFADWYAGWREQTGADRPLWLFPMNDPRQFTENDPPAVRFSGVDPWPVIFGTASGSPIGKGDAIEAVRHAQTFVVQFGPDGSVVTTPRAGETFIEDAYIEWPSAPVDRSKPGEDAYDWPDVFDPEAPELWGGPSSPGAPNQGANRSPNPEVFIRSADQLAVVDMNQLARETSIPRPWFVRPSDTGFPTPKWLVDLEYFEDDLDTDDIDQMPKHRLISHWIDRNAEILSFDRYSGKVIRRESP